MTRDHACHIFLKCIQISYLLSWDHNTNLLDGLGELIWLKDTVSVEVEVLERFLEHLLLGGDAR